MIRVRLSVLTLLTATGLVLAQPKPIPDPGLPVQRPREKGGPSGATLTGPRIIQFGMPLDTVEDPRPFLGGQLGQPTPKDMDPRVLKDLMDRLNGMPKDQ